MMPDLRAFGRSLAVSADAADDLVQETLVRALAARARFEPGTSMRAWTLTILRNAHYTQWRKTGRETSWDAALDMRRGPDAPQHTAIALAEAYQAMSALPAAQRQALLLVGAGGWSYAEVAQRMGCATGTIKSRVGRARAAVGRMADGGQRGPSGPRPGSDQAYRALCDEIYCEAEGT
ncbi:sigma-70 family RNA polymerase sigma factor [Polymorphobacter sp.]|uniref:sigma-70 family RNA polymerase sigma factor n=1 Tax=Polymorphobacter sp. TaxID=1909290 RepID=UPI003F71ABCD